MLVDITMPGGGVEALKQVSDSCPSVACIALTMHDDEATVSSALRAGARGYVLKGISGTELAEIVRTLHAGEIYITESLATRLLVSGVGALKESSLARINSLSERETQILRLIAKGMINKQIGCELALKEKTVKHYVTNILQKLHVSNRVEAALIAQQDLGR
jgi:two-component system, NarL family, nitrate/nitrite response regulator NarL